MTTLTPRLSLPYPDPTDNIADADLSMKGLALALDNLASQTVFKTADESVTSSVALQDDDHLFLTIPAGGGNWIFDAYLFVSGGNAAGDIKVGFTFPAVTACHFGGLGLITAIASGSSGSLETVARLSATSGTTINQYGVSTTPTYIHLHGVLIAPAAGTLRLQWGQRLSSSTATKVLSGSHLVMRKAA